MNDGRPAITNRIVNRIDRQRPDAPELAAHGPHAIGVRTLELVHPDQIDVAAIDAAGGTDTPLHDRRLTVEIWYPAQAEASGSTEIETFLRDGRTRIRLAGKAVRDAEPDRESRPYPLVIVSHGYPGNRFLMAHLAENLASKGYVAVSIDHPGSTYEAIGPFAATLLHRPADQMFVIGAMAQLSAESGSFLSGLIDADRSAVIGYSMGGYGAVLAAGGRLTDAVADNADWAPPGLLAPLTRGGAPIPGPGDPRLRTAIAFAPWGANAGFFDRESLSGLTVPLLVIAGSDDDVSGHENGPRAIFEGAANSDRALLTFEHAGHNCGAPFPAPEGSEAFDPGIGFAPFDHYADTVWDTVRLNNISQHFVTAWLGLHLKGEERMREFLALIPCSDEGVQDMGPDGKPGPKHTSWKGFADRTARAMRFERRKPGKKA